MELVKTRRLAAMRKQLRAKAEGATVDLECRVGILVAGEVDA